jgi:hypothetical protein
MDSAGNGGLMQPAQTSLAQNENRIWMHSVGTTNLAGIRIPQLIVNDRKFNFHKLHDRGRHIN